MMTSFDNETWKISGDFRLGQCSFVGQSSLLSSWLHFLEILKHLDKEQLNNMSASEIQVLACPERVLLCTIAGVLNSAGTVIQMYMMLQIVLQTWSPYWLDWEWNNEAPQ